MHRFAKLACLSLLSITIIAGIAPSAQAQVRPQDAIIASRNATEAELESVAIIERKVMVPMRDGKRMQADIYRPKDESKKYPVIFVRTPYNFNYWDIALGAPRDMSAALDAVKHGYAYIEMNERGRYFSEGDYDILGVPLTDSDDELDWMGALPWSAGQGRPHRLLLHRRVAAQLSPRAATRPLPPSSRRALAPALAASAPTTSRATGSAAAPCRCFSPPGSTTPAFRPTTAEPNFPPGTSQQALVDSRKIVRSLRAPAHR